MDERRPTLDYRPRGADRSRLLQVRISSWAGALVLVSAAVGIGVRSWRGEHTAQLLILPLILATSVYVTARVFESRSAVSVKLLKLVLALFALALACGLAFSEASIFAYAQAYGWTSPQAFGHPVCLALAAALVIFAITDVADLISQKRRK